METAQEVRVRILSRLQEVQRMVDATGDGQWTTKDTARADALLHEARRDEEALAKLSALDHISKRPHHVAAKARLDAMAVKIAEKRARIRTIEAILAAPADRDAARDDEVDRILSDSYVTPAREAEQLRSEHVTLREQCEILERGYRVAFDDLSRLQDRLSHSATVDIEGRHKQLASRQAAALRALQESLRQERALEVELHRAGYDARWLTPLTWNVLGIEDAQLVKQRIAELERYADSTARAAIDLGPLQATVA